MDRLHRTRLMFGDTGLGKLSQSTVMVVGCGAVGSFAIEALARTGIGNIIVVDFDKVEESNINRQIFATSTTIGMPKVDVAQNRIKDIAPDINVTKYNMFWDGNTDIDAHPDFVIDAIDSVDSKIALYQWCTERGIPFISSMGAALKTDINQIRIAPITKTTVCPLASRVRRLVREKNIPSFPAVFSTQAPCVNVQPGRNLGSLITVTGAFGLHLANYAIKYLVGDSE